MSLFIIDAYKDGTTVHRLSIEEGKYLMPKRLIGTFERQVDELIILMLKERPDRIIFDEFGMGRGLAELFRKYADQYKIIVEDNGLIVY